MKKQFLLHCTSCETTEEETEDIRPGKPPITYDD